MSTGDAWKYCDKLGDAEAVRDVVQAALQAFLTLNAALGDRGDAERFATFYDWPVIRRQLQDALQAVGHPAGDMHR